MDIIHMFFGLQPMLCSAFYTFRYEVQSDMKFVTLDSSKSFITSSLTECAMYGAIYSHVNVEFDRQTMTCIPSKCLSSTVVGMGYSIIHLIHSTVQDLPSCDCDDLHPNGINGVYQIQLTNNQTIDVFCEITASGGWTVVSRRFDGSTNFNRVWQDYKHGFGNNTGEFWLGNDNLHHITSKTRYQVRFDLVDVNGNTSFALYSKFSVGDESTNYTLTISGYSGTAGDSMANFNGDSMNGMPFSTPDQDNDIAENRNCANERRSGWWFMQCGLSNILGLYSPGDKDEQNMIWKTWQIRIGLAKTTMMIKPYI